MKPATHAPPPAKEAPYYVPPFHAQPSSTAPAVRGSNDWEVGLFECFREPEHSICALCCPCLSAAYTAHYIRQSALITGLIFFLINLTGILFVAVPPNNPEPESTPYLVVSLSRSALLAVAVMVLRFVVRAYYRIPGSVTRDCCAAMFCSCCALAQMTTHTERFKDRLSTLPAYDRRFEGESEWLRSEGDHVDDSRVEEGYRAFE